MEWIYWHGYDPVVLPKWSKKKKRTPIKLLSNFEWERLRFICVVSIFLSSLLASYDNCKNAHIHSSEKKNYQIVRVILASRNGIFRRWNNKILCIDSSIFIIWMHSDGEKQKIHINSTILKITSVINFAAEN